MQSLIILSTLLAVAFAQQAGVLGVASSVSANTRTTINYTPLLALEIVVDKASQVTLSAYASTTLQSTTTLPQGYTALTFTTEVGYTLAVTNGAVIISANLTTPAISLVAQQAANASARVGCLEFNAAANSFQEIAINSFSLAQGFNIPIPEAGTYVFVAVQANAATPNFYSRARQLIANTKALIRYSANFVLDVTVSAQASVNVTYYSANPAPKSPPARYVALNVYWNIDLNAQATVQATLNYTFTAAQLAVAGVKATQLQFGFYNTATAQWEFMQSTVDGNAMVVSQAVTHFSTWGVYGDNGAAPTPTPTAGNSASGVMVSFLLLSSALLLKCVSFIL